MFPIPGRPGKGLTSSELLVWFMTLSFKENFQNVLSSLFRIYSEAAHTDAEPGTNSIWSKTHSLLELLTNFIAKVFS